MQDLQTILDPRAAPRSSWRQWVLPIVLTLLLLALVATSVVLVLDRREPSPAQLVEPPADVGTEGSGGSPAQQAVASARLAAITYFTLDHATVEDDMDRLRDLGTPAFVEEYDRTAPALARRIVEERLDLTAALPRNGVATEYLSQDVAQLMVSVDVTTRSRSGSSTADYRTRVLLRWVDEHWWVSALDEVR